MQDRRKTATTAVMALILIVTCALPLGGCKSTGGQQDQEAPAEQNQDELVTYKVAVAKNLDKEENAGEFMDEMTAQSFFRALIEEGFPKGYPKN